MLTTILGWQLITLISINKLAFFFLLYGGLVTHTSKDEACYSIADIVSSVLFS